MSFFVKIQSNKFVKRHLVTGPIWLEMDGQDFPIDAWYDFPVVILGWWLSNLNPLFANKAVRCKCPFMDGPYQFEVIARKQADWAVIFIRDDLDGEKILLKGEVAPIVLISEVLSAADIVIALCKQKGWDSDDLVTLEKEAEAVRGLMKSFPK
jgi:hypothetical protein